MTVARPRFEPAIPRTIHCGRIRHLLVNDDEEEVSKLLSEGAGTWEQLGNNCARTSAKTREQGRPATKTSQQDRQSGPVCKTSTPGSNPGGASNHKLNPHRHLWPLLCRALPATWVHLGPNRQTTAARHLRRHVDAMRRPHACRC